MWGVGVTFGMPQTGTGVSVKTYYFSATGSDAANGLTPGTAKQTIAAANALMATQGAQPIGTRFLFKGGDSWSLTANALYPVCSNIYLGSYGTGRPIFNVSANVTGIYVEGSNVTVDNFQLTGAGGNFGAVNTNSFGVYGATYDGMTGTGAAGLSVRNCVITGMTYGINVQSSTTATTPAIDTVSIANNDISSCAIGIQTYSDNYSTSTYRVKNVVISSNKLTNLTTYGVAGDRAENITIQGNYCDTIGTSQAIQGGGPVGIVCTESKTILVQYNECSRVKKNITDGDAFDFEACNGAIAQYNYGHDCDGAGQLIENSNNYIQANSNIHVRYNIFSKNGSNTSANAGVWIEKLGTNSTNGIYVYNNTIYQEAGYCLNLVDTTATGFISSNILIAAVSAAQKGPGLNALITVNKNIMYGGTSWGTNTITSDPGVIAPSSGPNLGYGANLASGLTNYFQVVNTSAALNAGEDIASVYSVPMTATTDFFGIALSNPYNIGAYEGPGQASSSDTTPDQFTFTDVTAAALSTLYTSNTITVTGINAAANVSISGGNYSKNGGGYTNGATTASLGDTFSVQLTSSGSNSTATNCTLTIGGVSDTYTVTTDTAAYTFTNAEASAYVAAMSVAPSNTRKAIIDNFVGYLKSGRINATNNWTKIGMLALLKTHDEQAARINLKDPTNIATIGGGTPVFTADNYYTGAASGWLNWGKTVSTYLTNAGGGQNSASGGIGVALQGTRSSTATAYGLVTSTSWSMTLAGGNAIGNRNNNAGGSNVATGVVNASGSYFLSNRTASATIDGWMNAVKVVNAAANVSTTPDNATNLTTWKNSTSLGTSSLYFHYIGAGLTDNEAADWFDALGYYIGAF